MAKRVKRGRTGHPIKAPDNVGKPFLPAVVTANLDLILAALTTILFCGHLLLTAEYFIGSGTDMVSMEYPLRSFAGYWLSRGVLPLWNPYILGGIPFQAGVHGYLYPGWWLEIFCATGWAIKFEVVGHLALGAVGATLFARTRTTLKSAAFLGGVTYALSGFQVMHLFAGHLTLMATAAYVPWVLWAVDRVRVDWKKAWPLAVSLWGAMILCGHYQVIYLGMGAGLAFGLVEALVGTAPDTGWKATLGDCCHRTAIWAGGLLAGALVAAVQLLPMATSAGLSQRAQGGLEFAASFSSAPPALMTYLLPDLFGDKLANDFVGGWSYWESMGYLGIAPMVLVFLAPAVLNWRRFTPPFLLLGMGILLSLGTWTPLFSWYVKIVPGSDLFRAAGRMCLITTLFASLLAAMVVDRIAALPPLTLAAKRVATGIMGTFAATALLVCLWANGLTPESYLAWLGTLAHITGAVPALHADALSLLLERIATGADRLAVIALLTVTPLSVLVWRPGKGLASKGSQALVCAVLVIDLFLFGHRFMVTAPAEAFEWPPQLVQVMEKEPPGSRILVGPSGRDQNFPAMYGVSSVGGYDIFLDGAYAKYMNAARKAPTDRYLSFVKLRRNHPLLDRLGISLLVTKMPLKAGANRFMAGFDAYKNPVRLGDYFLHRAASPHSRAFIVHQATAAGDGGLEGFLKKLGNPQFDIYKEALLESGQIVPSVAPAPADEAESAEITVYEPNRVVIQARAASAGLLILSDTPHPGWKAFVDEAPVDILKVNGVMRGIPISAGTHTVEMRYLPRPFVFGLLISVFSILGLLGARAISKRRARSAKLTATQ